VLQVCATVLEEHVQYQVATGLEACSVCTAKKGYASPFLVGEMQRMVSSSSHRLRGL